MIRPDQIPDEVVEALKEYFDTSRTSGFLRGIAAAMLNAWPGVKLDYWCAFEGALLLPLPQKDGDA